MTLVSRLVNGVDVMVDDGATGDTQVFRLLVGAVGSEVVAPGSAADGLLVYTNKTPSAGTATLSNQTDQATSVQLLAANTSRKGVLIHNDSQSTLYVNFGATASATAFSVKIPSDALYEMAAPPYTGIINGIWSSDSTGAARITELT